ncbi:MAG: hypothetical protein LBL33_09975 [Tannerella sp.]|jgi:hypothetical protein|nr:hypothetical protein [Tannerella sp.]
MKQTIIILTGIVFLFSSCHNVENTLMSGTFNINLRVHSKKCINNASNDFWTDDLLSRCHWDGPGQDIYSYHLHPNLTKILPADDEKITSQSGSVVKREDDPYNHYSIDISVDSPTTEMITKTIVAWNITYGGDHIPDSYGTFVGIDCGKSIEKQFIAGDYPNEDFIVYTVYDTIRCQIKKDGNSVACEKIWVNNALKWEKEQATRPVADCSVYISHGNVQVCFVESDPDWN